tara:strand:+ start:452 stop:1747 length:1296 start_codon:yes stop_codon:yes gene_type:complete
MKDFIVIGGGIAGLSFGYFINNKATILEKNSTLGGLSRSYDFNGVSYDIGPHIIFSKHEEILKLHTEIIRTNKIKRSNKIFFKNNFIKYPFENDLSSLNEEDKNYCLQEFLNNPYENYNSTNMLQFFLKTFGEGITRLYLQPYNEKIWKYDPGFMDTQMVERIPKPPKEDVIKSANGEETEGYLHQLFFHYPNKGGFQSLIDAYEKLNLSKDNQVLTDIEVQEIVRADNSWIVKTNHGEFEANTLINTAPIHEFSKYFTLPEDILLALNELKFNSIYIVMIQVNKDNLGDNFALYVPNKETIFHRLSKLDFLGKNYNLGDRTTLMAEVTFRPGSYIASLSKEDITKEVINGLVNEGLIDHKDNVLDTQIKYEKYAYVIYDLNHRKNTDKVLNFFHKNKIYNLGRFAQFEYLNTDGVVKNALELSKTLNEDK